MKYGKNLIRLLALLTIIVIIIVAFCNWWVNHTTGDFAHNKVQNIPVNHVGLVLGTSKYLRNGQVNLYFTYRIDAAEELYKSGKVEYLLVSGDNRTKNYNEPERMRRELVKRGIPNNHIILDYAGFRTLDSVIRSNKIFGQDSITIISQIFHNQRALYIARHYGINAVAFNAQNVDIARGLKTNIRELMARVKMFIDLYITDKQPYFLGDPVPIPG